MGFFSSLFGTKDNSRLISAIREGAFLIDVRTAAEFAGGSVKNAVNIPLGSLANNLPAIKNKKNIVVFCRSGNRSSQAKRMLEKEGFRDVIDGGSWQNVHQVINS